MNTGFAQTFEKCRLIIRGRMRQISCGGNREPARQYELNLISSVAQQIRAIRHIRGSLKETTNRTNHTNPEGVFIFHFPIIIFQ